MLQRRVEMRMKESWVEEQISISVSDISFSRDKKPAYLRFFLPP